jgi:hypothetical protein
MRGALRTVWLGALVLLATALVPAAASAELVIEPGTTTLSVFNAAGEAETQAGIHPNRVTQRFQFTETGGTPEYTKDLVIEMPAGLSGNPGAVPLCPRSMIDDPHIGSCPAESQVGTLAGFLPLYSVEPAPGQAAVFAASFFGPITFVGKLRPGDLGLTLYGDNIGHGFFALTESELELWGVPADHQTGTSIPRKALLTNPTRCDGGPLAVTVSMHTWQNQGKWMSGSGDTGHPLTGCGSLPFDSSVAISLGSPSADTPTGANIDLTIPQSEDPDGLVSSQVRNVKIQLPEGMTVSPGGAGGLGSCSDGQLGLGGASEPQCPASSRVGSVELDVATLSKPMVGSIYLGQEHPGERFRLFAVAEASGAQVKFVATLQPDPKTGRMTTTLSNLPEASFGRLSLHFDGGPNALLATPLDCGRSPAAATVTPYSGTASSQWSGSVSVSGPGGSACKGAPQFAPTFVGGSSSAVAGKATAFTTTVRRHDGEQLPERLSVAFPPGVSAALGQVDPCPEAKIPSGACPASSRIGSTVAELGPGTSPARMGGEIFLTGPYKRAPFGLALVFNAKIGPFNLGTLVVRSALRIDSLSGQVSAETDALPTIFEGIPIRFQTIGLDLDRPGFMHNPTSCAPAAARATLRSAAGTVATPTSPFAVHGCISLPFRPDFSMRLDGGVELRREGKPGLRIQAKLPAGGANMRMADIAFPKRLQLDSSGVTDICAQGQAARGNCPKGSRVGSGFARTALLDDPMTGPIYVVQPHGGGTPDLWTSLEGQGLHVNLKAETSVEHGQAATRLVDVPDFPLRSFTMRLAGGEHGLLKLTSAPCAGGRLLAPMEIAGQNGTRVERRVPVAVQGGCGHGG